MRVLLVYASPGGMSRLRTDQEDRAVSKLKHRLERSSDFVSLHAAQVDDIRDELLKRHFDVIHVSAHGYPGIVCLYGNGDGPSLISANRLKALFKVGHSPILLIVLACYSDQAIEELSSIAPFVITTSGEVSDKSCVAFSEYLYESLLSERSVSRSFSNAINAMKANGIPSHWFVMTRTAFLDREGGPFLECTPDAKQDSIIVSLASVENQLGNFGMEKEVLLHLLERKLKIHHWIFSVPRDRCTIPIGPLLFGVFSWQDATKIVHCERIFRISSFATREQISIWHQILVYYNDLASAEYRTLDNPTSIKK